ncbi:MAG: polysaccharide biosynthesis tyrosine autokinase [Actinomycetota bacterium]
MLEQTPAPVSPPSLPPEGPSELREYLAVLRARKWSIAAITLVTVAAALFFSFRQVPIYESEAQVLVNPVPTSGFSSAPPPVPNLDTERTVAASLEVAELAADRLDGAVDPKDLVGNLSVEVATNSEVLIFRYSDPSPLQAQRVAAAFAQSYLEFRRQKALESVVQIQESIQQQIDQVTAELGRVNRRIAATQDEVERANLQTRTSQLAAQLAVLEQQRSQAASGSQLRVGDIIAEAGLPSSPASPNHVLNGALALLVGLALGVGFAFLRERLDDRLRGQGDLESRAGAPVLAVVPRVQGWRKKNETPLVGLTEPRGGPAEAYRTLRTGILFAASEREVRTILITSPHPGEGKTATAANLAVVLAQAGKRVIVVSADLRKPRLHRFFKVPNTSGLSGLLTGEEDLRGAVRDVGLNHLRVVPSGPVPKNPAELLGSHAMDKALERFEKAADLVIIDGPPVLDVADTITLTPFVDAVVIVADAETTSRGALTHARKQLEQVKANVIGAVFNNLDPTKARPYYYRYYYQYGYQYRYAQEEPRGRRGRARAAEEAAWEPPPSAPPREPSQPRAHSGPQAPVAQPQAPMSVEPQERPRSEGDTTERPSLEDIAYEELMRSLTDSGDVLGDAAGSGPPEGSVPPGGAERNTRAGEPAREREQAERPRGSGTPTETP